MLFHSTSGKLSNVSLRDALSIGFDADGGIFMPDSVPAIPRAFFRNISEMSLCEIGYVVCNTIFGSALSAAQIKTLVDDALDFEVPVRQVDDTDGLYVMELFHGPTLTFKDFGARFMARLVPLILPDAGNRTVILATSGDSGRAVADAYRAMPGTRVVVVFPKGALSREQLAMFADTPNVKPVEVSASYGDCQRLVKSALLDADLNRRVPLMPGNSVNVARHFGSVIYVFHAYARAMQLRPDAREVLLSIPCGNLGSLSAALMAKKMGLPVDRFIAANNVNDTFVEYLRTGSIAGRSRATRTMVTAMDVANPWNLSRISDLYHGDLDALRRDVDAVALTDGEILDTIRRVHNRCGYLLDPRGAAAFKAMEGRTDAHTTGIVMATGHPAMASEAVAAAVGTGISLPRHPNLFHGRKAPGVAPAPVTVAKIAPSPLALARVLLEE